MSAVRAPPDVTLSVTDEASFQKASGATDAQAADLRAYFNDLKGAAGINGFYDFKAVPNRGLDESNVVVTRWDAAAQPWAVVSDPLGIPRAQ